MQDRFGRRIHYLRLSVTDRCDFRCTYCLPRSHRDFATPQAWLTPDELARIVGLFTSVAYTHSPKIIPFLRHKVDLVIRRSGYPPDGHSGKALLNVIETYPRDELFQIDVNLLYRFTIDIQSLELKPSTRVYPRIDEFDRFVSLLVYVPRDRYSTEIRSVVQDLVGTALGGRVVDWSSQVSESALARLFFIVQTEPGALPEVDADDLEARIARLVSDWDDDLRSELVAALGETPGIARFAARP